MTGNIIELRNLRKEFGAGLVAVEQFSLAVEEGAFITLLGPSGCGKTTVLRMIAGFESPTRGRIVIGGEDVTDVPPYRRAVNMVFQDYALFPHMTVAGNVAYGLKVAGVPKREIALQVAAALAMVELADKARQLPHQLSGGQRQRVALARALVRKPKVLLLDEPLSALDANLRTVMQVELKHLHDRLGLTFVMVTHDQTEALVMSDRVVLMHAGRIAQDGPPKDIYEHPRSAYAAEFIGTSNLLHGCVTCASSDEITVTCGSHEFQARVSGALFDKGETVSLSVRPEKALLVDDVSGVPSSFNIVSGMVAEVLFHGDSVRLRIELAGGIPFLIDVQLTAARVRRGLPEVDTTVRLAIDPENLSVFPRETVL